MKKAKILRILLPGLIGLCGWHAAGAQEIETPVNCVEGQSILLAYGDHAPGCAISPVGDLDIFGFEGVAGETVRLIVRSTTSSALNPRVEILDPGLNTIVDMVCTGVFCSLPVEFDIPASGFYTIRVSDQTNAQSGNYNLQLQRVTPAGMPAVIDYDAPFSDMVSPDVDIDSYGFYGTPNTTVRLSIRSSTSSAFDPRVELRAPDGQLVDEFNCTGVFCSTSYEFEPQSTGLYSLLISDLGSLRSGSYNFNVQCITGPCDSNGDGTPDVAYPLIAFDEPFGGSVSPDVDIDGYRFYGEPGKTLRLSIRSNTSSAYDPRVELRDPAGVLVDEFSCIGVFCAANFEFVPASSGHYALLVSDLGALNSGNFVFNLQCVDGDCSDDSDRDGVVDTLPIALANDTVQTGRIGPEVDIDSYLFAGDPLSPVRISLVSTNSSAYQPRFELLGPDNQILLEQSCTGVFCSIAFDFTPPVLGSYRLNVSDLSSLNSGNYTIAVTCTGFSCPPDAVVSMLADNCKLKANGPLILDAGGNSQLDTNQDGYGNACDPDVSNDGTVDFVDLGLLKGDFFGTGPDTDFDGNAFVDFVDLGRMKELFFGPPGPSGLACAGTVPCPAP